MNTLAHLAALVVALPLATPPPAPARWWDDPVERALGRAGGNRAELEKALTEVAPPRRKGMAFLVANMPEGDLRALKADFLLNNVDLAYQARAAVPWGKDIPDDLFLNDVLPYANVDEKRDAWRKEFHDLCLPMVRDCKTPGEAAQKLNRRVFRELKVGYSTGRKAPNQSPRESIAQGKASCTGLSIVLCDACRAVCVPARLVGTPLWGNKRGNHTWVEVWDGGWHFTGACEADPHGLDRGWFVRDAAEAKKDSFEHAIYAASFRRTGTHFPLVWALRNRDVPAENVTDRYTRRAAPAAGVARLAVRVRDAAGRRTAVPVRVTAVGEPAVRAEGVSRGEAADANDLLTFDLPPDRDYVVTAGGAERRVRSGPAGELRTVEVALPAADRDRGDGRR